MDDKIVLGMSLMPTARMTTGIAHTYTGLALEPDPWLHGALGELRRTLDDDFASASGMQQRVWSKVLAKIEAEEIAEVDRQTQAVRADGRDTLRPSDTTPALPHRRRGQTATRNMATRPPHHGPMPVSVSVRSRVYGVQAHQRTARRC